MEGVRGGRVRMATRTVKPDRPSIRIDAATIDQMPIEIQEALGRFYTEQERQKAKAKDAEELEYQTLQAETLLSFDGWEEVETHPSRFDLSDEVAIDDGVVVITDPDVRAIVEQEREIQLPTLHQFYRDLYGIGIDGGVLAYYTEGDEGVAYYDREDVDILELVEDGWASKLRLPSPVLVNHRDRQHPYQLYDDYFEFVEGVEVETSFIHMGSFWVPPNGYLTAKKNAMTTINGFCVDLDRVDDEKGRHFTADWVMTTLMEFLNGHPELMPNYLMLSGTGIQLWYVFGRSIPLLSAKGRNGRKPSPRRGKYDALLKSLYRYFKENLPPNRFKVDVACAAINHAFRAPNSPAKHHYPTRLFVLGGRRRAFCDPLSISDFLGGDLKPYDVADWDQEQYRRLKAEAEEKRSDWREEPATARQKGWLTKLAKMGCIEEGTPFEEMTKAEADAAIKSAEMVFTAHSHYRETGGRVVLSNGYSLPLKPRSPALYRNVLERMEQETPTGSRYWALFALAGFGYNCNIPKHVVLEDMNRLKESDWGRKLSKDGKPVNDADIRSAIRGYNPIGAIRHRDISEEYLSWRFNPPQPRNGRSRQEHLWGEWHDEAGNEILNKAKAARQFVVKNPGGRPLAKKRRASAIDRLTAYLAAHPLASKRSACAELGMSRSTVTKYWADACAAAGVEDTRSGNHCPF